MVSLSAQGQTGLMLAAQAGNVTRVEDSISRGCDVNAKGRANQTVAHHACASGNLDIGRVLEDYGVDWNAKADATILGAFRQGVTNYIPFGFCS